MSENINVFFGLELKDGFSPTVQKAQAGLDDLKSAFKGAMQEVAEENKKTAEKIKQQQEEVVKSQNTMFNRLKSNVSGMVAGYLGLSALKKAFFDFAGLDKYIQKVGIIGHLSKEQMSQLRYDVKSISTEMGADATELAQAGMKLASARVPIEQMKEYLQYAVKVQRGSAEIGRDLTLPEITNFMSVLRSNFPTAQANEMADTMSWMLDKVPNINFLELSNSLAKSAPLAKSLNIGFRELLAIEANSIVNKGGAVASTEMRNVLQNLDKMRSEMMKKMKIGNIEFKQEGQLLKFIDELAFKYKNIPRDIRAKELDKNFGAGTGVILGQYLDELDKSKKLFNELKYDARGFVNELSSRVDSTPYDKLNKNLSQMKMIFLEIGDALDRMMVPDGLLLVLKGITDNIRVFGSGWGNIMQGFKSDIADISKGEYFKDFFSLNTSSAIPTIPIQDNQENKVKVESTITLANNSNVNLRVEKVENESNGANIEVAKVNYLNK